MAPISIGNVERLGKEVEAIMTGGSSPVNVVVADVHSEHDLSLKVEE